MATAAGRAPPWEQFDALESGRERHDFGPEDEAFLAWEQDHRELIDRMSRGIVATTQPLTTASAYSMGPEEYRRIATHLGVQLREVVALVDDAPDSPLRSAALGIFLQQIASIEELVDYAETGDEVHRQTGVQLMEDALDDLSRLERTYGDASLILRR